MEFAFFIVAAHHDLKISLLNNYSSPFRSHTVAVKTFCLVGAFAFTLSVILLCLEEVCDDSWCRLWEVWEWAPDSSLSLTLTPFFHIYISPFFPYGTLTQHIMDSQEVYWPNPNLLSFRCFRYLRTIFWVHAFPRRSIDRTPPSRFLLGCLT